MKNIKKVKCMFLFALVCLTCISLFNCAGKKGTSRDSVLDRDTGENSELEESKQAAESAEWEAHRLREELNRKNKAGQ